VQFKSVDVKVEGIYDYSFTLNQSCPPSKIVEFIIYLCTQCSQSW